MIDYQHFLKEEVPVLLAKLEADRPQLWGKMSAQHMVEHAASLALLANGKFAWTRPVATEIGDQLRKQLFENDTAYPKNLRVPSVGEEPGPLRFANMDEAKSRFLAEIDRFFSHFEANLAAKPVHPVFGELDFQEWLIALGSHTRHHFQQFGLLETT